MLTGSLSSISQVQSDQMPSTSDQTGKPIMSSTSNVVAFPAAGHRPPRDSLDHLVGAITQTLSAASDVLTEISQCPLSETSKLNMLVRMKGIFADALSLYSVILEEHPDADDLRLRIDAIVMTLKDGQSASA